jgi:hypothetical protein
MRSRFAASLALAAAMSVPLRPAHAVGGSESQPDGSGRYKAVGVVQSNVAGLCSGTLIAPRVVLTAAHCVGKALQGAVDFRVVTPGNGSDIATTIRAPTVVTQNETVQMAVSVPTAVRRLSSNVYRVLLASVSPNWQCDATATTPPTCPPNPASRTLLATGDAALLYLDRPVSGVTPLSYASASSLRNNSACRVVGYGLSRSEEVARRGTVGRRRVGPLRVNPAGNEEIKDIRGTLAWSDHGDSGGPLLCGDGSRDRIVGVVSGGERSTAQSVDDADDKYFAALTGQTQTWLERTLGAWRLGEIAANAVARGVSSLTQALSGGWLGWGTNRAAAPAAPASRRPPAKRTKAR